MQERNQPCGEQSHSFARNSIRWNRIVLYAASLFTGGIVVSLDASATTAAAKGDRVASPEPSITPLDARALDAAFGIIERGVAENEFPGAVVLVARNGQVLREAAYGFSDLTQRTRFSADTVCWIASITKPVTAAAVMKLVETGKLALHDPVTKYLPEFGEQVDSNGRKHTITIQQLLTHTSGIVENPPHRRDIFSPGWHDRTLAEVLPSIAEAELLFTPGTKGQYSNAAYYVLGRLIEVVAQEPYHRFVRRTLLAPLGMNDSAFALEMPPQLAERTAVVYRLKDGRRSEFHRFDPAQKMVNGMPDGGLYCTARDLLKFYQQFIDGESRALRNETIRAMLKEHAPNRGLGWSLRHGGFAHGGSSGAFAWGDPDSGVVGIVLVQDNDFARIQTIRSEFVTAVRAAYGGKDVSPAASVRANEPWELRLRNSSDYANPYTDVAFWANLESPTGRQLKLPGFCERPGVWMIRASFDEPGIWWIHTVAEPHTPALTSSFALEVTRSASKGMLRVTMVPNSLPSSSPSGIALRTDRAVFQWADGSPFFHAGDTAYSLLWLDRETQVLPYLKRRAAQGFSHVRIQASRSNDPRFSNRWPWGGTPEAADLDRFNPEYFERLDRFMHDLRQHGLGVEMIMENYYSPIGLPMPDPKQWTRRREEAWLRYLIARYSAFDNLLYWTLANEFETYPDGTYRLDVPGDIQWARQTADLVKRLDPYLHPVTVHPYVTMMEYLVHLGNAPELDLLILQEHGRERKVEATVFDGTGDGLDEKVLAARMLGKPIVVGEYGYEWDGMTKRGINSTTNLLRRHTWRIVMAGGHFSAGFRSSVYNFPGMTFDPDNGGRPGGDQIAALIRFFTKHTQFQFLEPRFEFVSTPNLCLRGKGEWVIYAPVAGSVTINLEDEKGIFTVTRLDPVTGEYVDLDPVTGGRSHTLAASDETVFHLKTKQDSRRQKSLDAYAR